MHHLRSIFVGLYLSLAVTSVVHAASPEKTARASMALPFNTVENTRSIDRTTPVNLTRPVLAEVAAAPAADNSLSTPGNPDDRSAGLTWLAGLALIGCIAIRRMA
jgi:hypothetical protein